MLIVYDGEAAVEQIFLELDRRKIPKMKFYNDVGVSAQTMSMWKKGRVQPSQKTLQKIVDYLGVAIGGIEPNKGTKKEAPGISPEALRLIADYADLDVFGKNAVQAVLQEELKRVRQPVEEEEYIANKIIPLFAAAAGPGEPADGEPFESYDVPEDSNADFAVRISGDSMEPHFKNGQVVLCKRGYPEIGDIAVVSVNGNIYVKQFVTDGKNVFLVSLNRKRSDCDYTIWHNSQDTVKCYGTVIMDKRLPLAK